MGFPTVLHCLVCEDYRAELNQKATLAGFYGVTPNVSLVVGELGKALERLVFVLVLDVNDAASSHVMTPMIVGPDDKPVAEMTTTSVVVPGGIAAHLAVGLLGVVFSDSGQHKLVLSVDGKEHYRTAFNVRAAQPGTDEQRPLNRGPIGTEAKSSLSESAEPPTTATEGAPRPPVRAAE
jgi:hypothetical protein